MYCQHRAFDTPPNYQIVWRYMSFTKFVWLIAKESLHFSRLDQHNDWWEGMLPRGKNIENKKYIRYNKFINCWHMNDSESDAMWKLYGNPIGETVAIRTTVGCLKKSLKNYPFPVYMGKINYKERNVPEGNLYFPVIYKRKPFQHEQELRLCISGDNSNPPHIDLDNLKEIGMKGMPVHIDLNHLIDKVVICPNSSHWLFDSVEYIVNGKIPNKKIVKSII